MRKSLMSRAEAFVWEQEFVLMANFQGLGGVGKVLDRAGARRTAEGGCPYINV